MITDTHSTEYLTLHNLPIDGLMEGLLHFGSDQVEKICKEALSKEKEIEFYYATEEDEIADKLSYRFIPGKNQ